MVVPFVWGRGHLFREGVMAFKVREFTKIYGGETIGGQVHEAVFTMFGLFDEDYKRIAYSWKRGPMEALRKELEGQDG